jgi:segregation and condensation protein B
MSLKAKLEAVIYAAEEPVTLAQLTALFTADALEYKAERAATVATDAVSEPPSAGPLPLLDEGVAYLGLDQTPGFAPDEPGRPGGVSAADSNTSEAEAPAIVGDAAAPFSIEEGQPAEVEPSAASEAADPEADLKREARLRDREVRAVLQELIDELIASYASDGRGIEIREIAGGYRVATKPEYHDTVRLFVRSLKPPLKLSLQALETLAVVAYKQPVTAPEVSEIRGVESAGTLGSLLSRKLIATAGRKPVIGRPILYKTTREFLLRFGLKDVSELPSMEEFEKMAAIELDEQAAAAENGDASKKEDEDSSQEVALDDSFERTAEETFGEGARATEAQSNNGGKQTAEADPGASVSAEPAETEASPHGQ